MTATVTVPVSGPDDGQPVAVARAITGLLRALPPPDDSDPAVRAQWFARKAALLDAIASAAAYPALAVEARCLAREARATARTYLRTALNPTVSPEVLP